MIQNIMKSSKVFLLLIYSNFLSTCFSQVSYVDFNYTVNNNLVTFIDTIGCSCSGISYTRTYYNFGDTASGTFNHALINGANHIVHHYFNNPGVYLVCAYSYVHGDNNCICEDTICKQVTITTTGVNCNANFCYTSVLDSNNNNNNNNIVINFFNYSTSDDSIVSFAWGGCGGFWTNWSPIIQMPYGCIGHPVSLSISTQNGCKSSYEESIIIGSTCDSVYVTPNGDHKKYNIELLYLMDNSCFKILNTSEIKEFSVYIYDILGKLVIEKQIKYGDEEFYNLNLQTGIYLYKIIANKRLLKANRIFVIK